MSKTKTTLPRALLLAGLLAGAGVAQAQTATVTTYTTTTTYPVVTLSPPPPVATVQPPMVSDGPDTVITQVHRPDVVSRSASAATFNVPSRAGEASTMTGGAPNMSTDNHREIVRHGHPVVVVN